MKRVKGALVARMVVTKLALPHRFKVVIGDAMSPNGCAPRIGAIHTKL